MAMRLKFLPVDLAFLAQIRVVRVWSQHDRIALGGGPADRIWRTGRDPGVRMGLLERFRQDFDILKMPVVSIPGETFVLPGRQDDFHGLSKTRMAFLRRHAER